MEKSAKLLQIESAIVEVFDVYGFRAIEIKGAMNYERGGAYYRFGTWGERFVLEGADSLQEAENGLYEDAVVVDACEGQANIAIQEVRLWICEELQDFMAEQGYQYQAIAGRHTFHRGEMCVTVTVTPEGTILVGRSDKECTIQIPADLTHPSFRAYLLRYLV